MRLDPPLRTSRLVLRTLSAADADARYLGWMRDPETIRFLEARLGSHTLGSLEQFIERCNDSEEDLLLGICLVDGEHIGNIKIGPVDPYHLHAAVGLLLGERSRWGHGYATEAIEAVTRHAFTAMGLRKLYAGCYASNVGSARAFVKAGWSVEGRSKDHWRLDDGREDDIRLGITAEEWHERRG